MSLVARRRTDVRQRARGEQGAAEGVSPPSGRPRTFTLPFSSFHCLSLPFVLCLRPAPRYSPNPTGLPALQRLESIMHLDSTPNHAEGLSPPPGTMILAQGLSKSYGTVKAVDSIDLAIDKGEVFGLLGPNGAGKTTTIKMLTALSRPDAGTCRIGGHDTKKWPPEAKRLIGVMPQENNLDRELTARENLLIYGMLHGVGDLARRIADTLILVGLAERDHSLASHLSGGMQRRLLLGRALMTDPAILFLDEPSIGLDPQIRHQMWDIIRKARIDGRTVVITTHYIEEAESLCDRIGIMVKGRLIALGTPSDLKTRVGNYVVEFVNGEGHLVQHMYRTRGEAQNGAGHIEEAVTIRRSNLEDVFIELTGERLE